MGAPQAPRYRRVSSEVRVCVVTTGCDDDEAAGPTTGTPRLVCSAEGGASTGGGGGGSGNTTTLRACIEGANAQYSGGEGVGGQRIEFANWATAVYPTRALPTITAPFVTIDGPADVGQPAAMVRISGAAVPMESETPGLVGPPRCRLRCRSVRAYRCGYASARLPFNLRWLRVRAAQ